MFGLNVCFKAIILLSKDKSLNIWNNGKLKELLQIQYEIQHLLAKINLFGGNNLTSTKNFWRVNWSPDAHQPKTL